MQCIWLTKPNVITSRIVAFAHSAGGKTFPSKSLHSGIWRICSKPHLNPTSSYHTTPRIMESPALDLSHPHSPAVIKKSASSTSSSFVVDHLSSPQISRASAAAIRISVARGDIWDSFHLWHSLRWSMHRYCKPGSAFPPQSPFRTPSSFVPIDFARPVSARLAAHCLLHSLLRAGETKTAAVLTEQMMADGEELHPLSFSTLLRQLNSTSSKSPQTVYNHLPTLPRSAYLGSRVLELQNVMPMDPFTCIAVRLLNNAREHRWQRTTSMYESVLRACLIQGEILVASLLLALLLKDYQLRHACSRIATEAKSTGAQDTTSYIHSKFPETPSRGFKLLPYYNSRFLYQSVAEFLEKHSTHIDNPLFSEASQALAIFASELNARRIPYANLATLFKAMYSYPRCQHTVWVTLPSGERQSRNAYLYFHEVLLNLLCSLPDQKLVKLKTGQLPSLNMDSYNALLHYALCHRHSLTLANRVLRHMTELRKPTLAPTTATYNILLRGSTLMRRNDIAESILRMMPWQISVNDPDEVHNFPRRTLQGRNCQIEACPTDSQLGLPRHRFSGLLEDTRKSGLNIPKPEGHIEPDVTLLTSCMAHLVASGRPDRVAILITQVIPELEPPQERSTPEECEMRWQTSIVRGVTLGPHFFAAALNALRKAGLRRLAKRVWALALAAETKNLQSGVTAPWCLSVHAYTAMLQLYADETKGRRAKHIARCVKQPRHPPRIWDWRLAISSMRKGMQVFRALSFATIKVREAAVQAREEGREWKHPPVPPRGDARFYNAALRLVFCLPGMRPHGSRHGTRSWWNNLLREVRQHFLLTGQKPPGWIPELEEIAESMRSSGYAPPVGLRLRLVGRDEQSTSQDKTSFGIREFGVRPYSFGRKGRSPFAPYRLPTVKRKGLPLRGRWRRSRWSKMR